MLLLCSFSTLPLKIRILSTFCVYMLWCVTINSDYFLNNNGSVFIMEGHCVLFEVGTGLFQSHIRVNVVLRRVSLTCVFLFLKCVCWGFYVIATIYPLVALFYTNVMGQAISLNSLRYVILYKWCRF